MSTTGPEENPGFLLWHITLRWQREVVAALAPLDLTHVQFVLLATLWWHTTHDDEDPNQLALARYAGTDVKMTSQVVRKLEAKGLLVREVDPDDTRARRLQPTRRGAALAQRAIVEVQRVNDVFFAPAGDSAAVLAMLRSLAGPR
ncbi:MarR family transcriptional regulator [Amycolatopsis mediterranei]|uniref:MarR family winged helix-turn-helix transcriptional regulator n=1 Tax=Amycolatopsis mediterranei TaxID=33910 RepID=UPI00343C6CA4